MPKSKKRNIPHGRIRTQRGATRVVRGNVQAWGCLLTRSGCCLDSRWHNVRERVLIHMAFNTGVERLRAQPRVISAVQFRFWEAAAEEMMISDWAKQERRRASVLAEMMRTGRDEPGV
jgi:hypothetical protein